MNKPEEVEVNALKDLHQILAEKDLALQKLMFLLDTRIGLANSDELDNFADTGP